MAKQKQQAAPAETNETPEGPIGILPGESIDPMEIPNEPEATPTAPATGLSPEELARRAERIKAAAAGAPPARELLQDDGSPEFDPIEDPAALNLPPETVLNPGTFYSFAEFERLTGHSSWTLNDAFFKDLDAGFVHREGVGGTEFSGKSLIAWMQLRGLTCNPAPVPPKETKPAAPAQAPRDPQPVTTVSINVHLAEPVDIGYQNSDGRAQHLDVQLYDAEHRATLRKLFAGLDESGARLANGKRIANHADAVRWVLETIEAGA